MPCWWTNINLNARVYKYGDVHRADDFAVASFYVRRTCGLANDTCLHVYNCGVISAVINVRTAENFNPCWYIYLIIENTNVQIFECEQMSGVAFKTYTVAGVCHQPGFLIEIHPNLLRTVPILQ